MDLLNRLKEASHTSITRSLQQEMVEESERLLPIANVGRIMKQILPPNAKISKEAKETMQECVTEFISFVTGEASDKCQKENRKTINGDDICCALNALGFDNYAEAVTRYLHKYRANQSKVGSNSFENKAQEAPTISTLEFTVINKGNSSLAKSS
ncbi:hypothetical protein Nepgr_014997 [Nepenthes gracilis]|uniref:Transcription factor CBF/NF-Y/archaeal histone domain-containing protein n=1 Tax=Nepenthes gracilis TaxID=150966 RepID=A0AAD3XQX2_NEPGR|nr:hypothetical protein Nepgr_014997 [Nepenthes gracilis]